MLKADIRRLFIAKRILSDRSGLVRRPYNWKVNFDSEALSVWNTFKTGYRSDEEAWFCLCRDIEPVICPICGSKKVKFTGAVRKKYCGYNTTCEDCSANAVPVKIKKVADSTALRTVDDICSSNEKRRQTNINRHGSGDWMQYGSKSFLDLMESRYNDTHYNNHEKTSATCMENFGYSTNLLIPEVHSKAVSNSWSDPVRERRIANCMAATGYASYNQVLDIQERMRTAKLENVKEIEAAYGCIQQRKLIEKYGQGWLALDIEKLCIDGRVFIKEEDVCAIEEYSKQGTHTNGYVSGKEKELLNLVRTIFGTDVSENVTSVVKNENHRFFELDMYIDRFRLAIDFNGAYWHSDRFKDMYYHQRKTRCCRAADVRMLHIYEDVWDNNRQYVEGAFTRLSGQGYQFIFFSE